MNTFIRKLEKISQWAEIFYHENIQKSIEFKHGKLKGMDNKQSSGYAVRLLKDGKIGFSNSTDLNDDLIKAAVEVSAYGKECSYSMPPGPGMIQDLVDPAIDSIPVDSMIEYGNRIIEKIKKYDPDITTSVGFGQSKEHVKIANTNGLNSEFTKNHFGMSFHSTLMEHGNILDWWKSSDEFLPWEKCEKLADELIEDLKIARNNVTMNTGNLPVIISPECLPLILKAIESGIDGENVYKKLSPVAGKLNEQVLHEKFTLIDDGTLEKGSGSYPFDDEGVISQKKFIFKDGVLMNYLHNLESAYELKQEPTGNGFRTKFLSGRDYAVKPGIESTNLIIEKGDTTLEQMLADIKEGILLQFSPDAWMGNIINGEVQGNIVMGLKIENGKIIGRVKDLTFSANIYDLFNKQLVAIGNKLYTPNYSSNYRLPYIYVKDVSVS